MAEDIRDLLKRNFEESEGLEDENLEELEEEGSPELKQLSEGDTDDGELEDPEEDPIEYPQSWSPEIREALKALPPEHVKYLSRRESEMNSDYTRKTQELAEQRKSVEHLLHLNEKWAKKVALDDNTSLPQHIERLLFAYEDINSNPVQGIAKLMRDFNIDPSVYLQNRRQQQVPPEVQRLYQRLNQLESQHMTRQQQDMQQKVTGFAEQIKALESQEEFRYMPKVIDKVQAFFPAVQRLNKSLSGMELFKEAYRMAIASDPEVQAEVQAERRKQEIRNQNQKAKVAKRKAGFSATDSQAGSDITSKRRPRDIRDHLKEVARNMGADV